MTDGEWRVLPIEPRSAAENMALDEAIQEAVAAGDAPPTLRFYRWEPSAVSIGYFQALHDEVDVAACEEDGVDVVRRRTGGGAVYHDRDGEVTYSVIAPLDMFPEDLTASYEAICGRVVDAFGRLGIDASFAPINDVVADERKLSGSAQTRREGALWQHGTVLHRVDPERMFRYLEPDVEKVTDKHLAAAEERVASVVELAGGDGGEADGEGDGPPAIEDTYEALHAAFTAGRDAVEGAASDGELARAETVAERYRSDEWTAQR